MVIHVFTFWHSGLVIKLYVSFLKLGEQGLGVVIFRIQWFCPFASLFILLFGGDESEADDEQEKKGKENQTKRGG